MSEVTTRWVVETDWKGSWIRTGPVWSTLAEARDHRARLLRAKKEDEVRVLEAVEVSTVFDAANPPATRALITQEELRLLLETAWAAGLGRGVGANTSEGARDDMQRDVQTLLGKIFR